MVNPAIPFFTRAIVAVSFPPLLVFAAARHFDLPTWLAVLAALLSVPVWPVLSYFVSEWRVRRAAARLGATFPPRWMASSVGGIDAMRTMLHSFLHGYLADCFWDTTLELGPTFETLILWQRNYFTSDPNAIKCVLSTEFTSYVKGPNFHRAMKSVLGEGVFNSDGDLWKFHRSMSRPFFSKDRISHFDLFDRHAELAISKMKERFIAGHAVDFQDVIGCFTLDSATEFLFGSCVNSLRAPLPYAQNARPASPSSLAGDAKALSFAKAFAAAQHVIAGRTREGWIWPIFEVFGDRTSPHMRVVNAFLGPILEDALAKKGRAAEGKRANAEEAEEDETLLDHLVQLTDDPVVLHDEVLNILIAGRDTTAATLTFLVYFLSTHPAVLQRLRTEVFEHVGPHRRPTYDDIREMKYLRAVLNETMRLYPAVPLNIRNSVRDTTIPNPDPTGQPIFVPANTPVSYSVFLMHRNPEYWGPDAEEFDPDRFLDERVSQYLTPNPFIFLPFNAGPRICLGQQFAYNEMSFFVIRLLQRFSAIEHAPDAHPPGSLPPTEWVGLSGRKGIERFWPKVHLTAYSNGGLWVRMTPAEHDDDGHQVSRS